MAERELATALESLRSGDRADKKMISAALQVAFDRLTAAKRDLAALVSQRR